MWVHTTRRSDRMYNKRALNTKKILIETETTEILRVRLIGPTTVRVFCTDCEAMEEMLDLNSAADISGTTARDLLTRVESRELHSPEISSGHLLICRASLERSINADPAWQDAALMLEENI